MYVIFLLGSQGDAGKAGEAGTPGAPGQRVSFLIDCSIRDQTEDEM